jgi:hypothetical protein
MFIKRRGQNKSYEITLNFLYDQEKEIFDGFKRLNIGDFEENFLKDYDAYLQKHAHSKLQPEDFIKEQIVPNISVKFLIYLNKI